MNKAFHAQDPLIVDRLAVRLNGFHLENISFRIEPGQVTALLGHNGAGKTTTLRLLMGMVRKDSGQVSLASLDHVRDEKEFKRRVGFVPEECFFYGAMTIAEFLTFASRFHRDWDSDQMEYLLRTFNLDKDKKLGQLSKGMRMKVSLTAALSHQPDVLLLDEPTSGLDPRSQAETLRLLKMVAHENRTAVLISTHNLHEVEEIADRMILLDQGRVLADESLAALRCSTGESWNLEQYYLERVQ